MNEQQQKQLIEFLTAIKKKGAIDILTILKDGDRFSFSVIKKKVGLSDKQNWMVLKALESVGLVEKWGVWIGSETLGEVLTILDALEVLTSKPNAPPQTLTEGE